MLAKVAATLEFNVKVEIVLLDMMVAIWLNPNDVKSCNLATFIKKE